MIDISKFSTKKELFAHLHEHKSFLIQQKKSTVKCCDAFSACNVEHIIDKSGSSDKQLSEAELLAKDAIRVKSVINTTNILDSHSDVHINKIWNKSLSDRSQFYLVKEHHFNFDHVISDEVKAGVQEMTWKELGFDFEGKTEALIFESVIKKGDKTGMFERYAKGKVKNHSVGMQYVKLSLAIDDEDYAEEKEVWDKYINQIANKQDAIEQGYFWAVTEAKVIEGSAVLMGSNYATPTQSVTEIKNEPPCGTQSNSKPQDALAKLITDYKNKKN